MSHIFNLLKFDEQSYPCTEPVVKSLATGLEH